MREKVKIEIDLEFDITVKTVLRNAVKEVADETLVAKITEEAEKTERKRVAKKRYEAKTENRTILKIQKASENAVYRATRTGKLIRPNTCSSCGNGSHKEIQAHHECYLPENWLNVVWLCEPCHKNLHTNKQKNGGNHAENKSCSIVRP